MGSTVYPTVEPLPPTSGSDVVVDSRQAVRLINIADDKSVLNTIFLSTKILPVN